MEARALVVGGDGRIARALIPALARHGYEVVATTRRRVPDAARVELDLAEVARTGSARLPDCDVAFVCAAMSSYAECRSDEAAARAVNVGAPAAIARALRGSGAQLVILSTNGVFDGEQPFRSAGDTPDGATAYGRSKAAAEQLVRAIDPDAAVLRLTRVFRAGEPLLAGWADRLRAREPVEAFADMVAAPVAVDHAAAALVAIARRRAAGILQLSARREVSYVQIARHIAARAGAPLELVQAVAAATRGIGPGEAPRHASLACEEFLPGFGLAPIEPFDVVDAVLR
ncbi:MAG TPA: sugar nucleotide-binding protein [Myxococcota bacterium]|nr:sugar nucleotide-binding protein [Myxococcota bacterium]